jgi:Domain of unknown function (DUF4173)
MSLSSLAAATENSVRPMTSWTLWGVAAVLAVIGTAMLYSASPGINWALWVLAFSLSFLGFSNPAGMASHRGVAVPLALACFIAFDSALTADTTFEVFIAIFTLFALAAAVLTASQESQADTPRAPSVLKSPCAAVIVACEAFRRFSEVNESIRDGRNVSRLRGIAIALPITLLLALLLSQADPTFGAAREFVIRAFEDLSVVPRTIFLLVLGTCLVGAFGIASSAGTGLAEPATHANPARLLFGDTERVIVSGSIAALFTLFFALQISYLFGNPGGRSGSGVSYADAVHRGFAELNIVSSVCAVLLFVLHRYAFPTRRRRLVHALEWVVVIQAQILLVSAFYRVNLYEAAYGFTRLRLYVQVYAAIAFVALCCLLIELRTEPIIDRLLRRTLAVAALAFGSLILVNSDAWIARKNLQRYAQSGQIDLRYLTNELGPDAVPELVAALPQLPQSLASQSADCIRDRYFARANDRVQTRWFEWSLRRAALNRALARMDLLVPATAIRGCPDS